MCGITGFFGNKNFADHIENSVNQLTHRGPDFGDFWVSDDQHLGLGHRRLSIQDISSLANQPFTSSDGMLTMVFNGEIYNFQSLREELINDGYSFQTTSDTEVLLYLFHQMGNKCWEKLNGFFAVAIYNHQSQELTIARDRFGIKPLYYYIEDKKLVFASELKAILAYGIDKKIDYKALNLYFKLNYIPAPHSIIKNVKKLDPGHYITFNLEGYQKTKYYQLDQKDSGKSTLRYADAQKQLKKLLQESVEKRLVSDVPLGTFLSGGIDSSIITALASEISPNLNTFSIGFKDNSFFDETHYARLVADKYKTNHKEILLDNNSMFESLESLLSNIDEPFADSSALAVNALCKETRKHVTVALSGDGADELFAGYNKYWGEYKIQNPNIKEQIVQGLHPLWNALPKSRNNKITNLNRKLHKFSSGSRLLKSERYIKWCSIGDNENTKDLLLNVDSDTSEISKYITNEKGINDILYNDIHLVLPDDMLTKVDRMSMNNSLEVRVPFLDHDVVNFANSLPDKYKIDHNFKKKILQDAFRDMLPKELYNRPKQGFEVPLLNWLKTDLDHKIRHIYLDREFIEEQGIFNYDAIHDIINKLHSNNPEDSHATVWALIVFQSWYKKHME